MAGFCIFGSERLYTSADELQNPARTISKNPSSCSFQMLVYKRHMIVAYKMRNPVAGFRTTVGSHIQGDPGMA